MSIKRRKKWEKVAEFKIGNLPELDAEQAAAVMLQFTWHMAEQQGLCPLCLMHMAMDMMANAEKAGAIHHKDEFRASETLQ